ncbi:MAG: hypothetical protein ABIP39_05855 [Polyangiaceae bacterium]
MRPDLLYVSSFFLALAAMGCSKSTIALHAPNCPPSQARTDATRVEIEPISIVGDAHPEVPGDWKFAPPGPAHVLTGGMSTELLARALEGGEQGGYVAHCRLDRFAMRTKTETTIGRTLASLYVDLACDVNRKADKAIVWRGALRGRGISAADSSVFLNDDQMLQSLADRLMSDVSRELASDLAVRVLALKTKSSGRVFANEAAEREGAGINDTAMGGAALSESQESAKAASSSLRDPDPMVRAAAWNVIAMASAPDEEWVGGIDDRIDDDAFVRFYQYKAFARHGSRATLSALRRALRAEPQPLLEEFLKDILSGEGLVVRGGRKANAETNGTTTSP